MLKCEEDFWRQRAKVFWLQSGDLNTRAFHNFANGRKKKQVISSLQNHDGYWVDKTNGLNELVFQYFDKLYKSQGVESEAVISCVDRRVTDTHNALLIAPFLEDEVKEAVFSIHNDKSAW